MSVPYRVPPEAEALIRRAHDQAVNLHAEFGAQTLYDNLDDSTSARTGFNYPDQPNVSSNRSGKEFSQRQRGVLQGMADHGSVEQGTAWFGLNPKDAEQLEQAINQEEGNTENHLVGRANVFRTGADRTFHNASAGYIRSHLK